jgi:hypothetical protein
MTVFLNDSIAIAGRPKIVVIVDDAAVGDIRNDLRVAEAIHYIAVGIEFNVKVAPAAQLPPPCLSCHCD